jgi:hypothetical protein
MQNDHSGSVQRDDRATGAGGASPGPRELVRRTLAGETASRAVAGPLAVHYCAALAGVSLRDYTLNPRLLADSVLRYCERFHPDAVWLSADTWVTAEAMGAEVARACRRCDRRPTSTAFRRPIPRGRAGGR